ncbi:MAG: hypothetical protein LC102_11310 [Ignavibacteriales bacterium]|nr:hypothetical protein [Ignavibacteriaceae bacterium]MBW7872190.1 hypothetical protein [Ignavibacteria bacterium]MBZ0197363.1 hypothetical protein [Ignavibacteriaceae bacterium]MCZ2144003.1 hypothetical protein [Ignavibacteriales bacterium]WKZ73385.1 MAG: potassium transporter TrkG [Ignavibacteriaceae bacterium]
MEERTEKKRALILKWLRVFMVLSATVGFLTIILQHGFRLDLVQEELINGLSIGVVAVFVLYQLVNFYFSDDKLKFIRSHIFESTVIIFLIVESILTFVGASLIRNLGTRLNIKNLTFLYVVLAQIYIVIGIILGAVRYNQKVLESKIHPARLFMLSFAVTILTGTFLLMMPAASSVPSGVKFVDALFTSTSAVCVTGLTVLDTATQFTRFGQVVIMLLFQIGGLGLMTFTTFFALFLSGGLGIKEKFILREMMHEDSVGMIGKVLSRLVLLTFTLEAIGAGFIFYSIKDFYQNDVGEAVFSSVFHSIAAFCNSGFSIYTMNLADPMAKNNYLFITTVSLLIILGGIGFTTLLGVPKYLKINRSPFFTRLNMPLQVKLVLGTTATLIVLGTLVTYLLEINASLKGMDTGNALFHAYFQSVSARTAGFSSVNIAEFTDPTTFFYCFLMFVGASPGGTGGGIKTTTFAIIFLSVWMYRNSTRDLRIQKRIIPPEIINLAFMIFWLSIFYILFGVFLLSIAEPGMKFVDLMFEAFSAAGTVGLSKDVSSHLSDFGKYIDILLMYIGRIGPLTIIFSFIGERDSSRYSYPKDNIAML